MSGRSVTPLSAQPVTQVTQDALRGLADRPTLSQTPQHLLGAGVVVGVSGVASGVQVIAANGFINSPAGFRWVDGHATDIDPVAAMFNDAWASESLHTVIAAFVSTGFAAAGLHAFCMLRGSHKRSFHQHGLRLLLAMGAIAALLQPLSGDLSAKT